MPLTSRSEVAVPIRPQGEPDTLGIDSLTLKDLEIFESQPGGTSLFEYCNRTRT
jgi:DNA mismatch repair ATPase MutS